MSDMRDEIPPTPCRGGCGRMSQGGMADLGLQKWWCPECVERRHLVDDPAPDFDFEDDTDGDDAERELDSLRSDAHAAVRAIAALMEERDSLRAQLAEAQDRMWRLEDQVTMQQIARAYEDSDGLRAQLAERWWGEFVAVWAAIGWHVRWWDTYQCCPDCRKYEDELAERDATCAEMRRALEDIRESRANAVLVEYDDGEATVGWLCARALSPDAGKRHMERDAAMERVVEAARRAEFHSDAPRVAVSAALAALLRRADEEGIHRRRSPRPAGEGSRCGQSRKGG